MGRKKIHATNGAKVAASRNKWKIKNPETGVENTRIEAWIPDTPEDREKLHQFAANLRRMAGTFVAADLIL